jgi:hypothetical protein
MNYFRKLTLTPDSGLPRVAYYLTKTIFKLKEITLFLEVFAKMTLIPVHGILSFFTRAQGNFLYFKQPSEQNTKL